MITATSDNNSASTIHKCRQSTSDERQVIRLVAGSFRSRRIELSGNTVVFRLIACWCQDGCILLSFYKKVLLFMRTASFDAIVLAYFQLANWLGSPFGKESSGEALHGGQRYPVDVLIPRMSCYSLRVCGYYLLDWGQKSHRWCNEKAINWLVVN